MRSPSGRIPATPAAEVSELPTDMLPAAPPRGVPPVPSMHVSPPRGAPVTAAPALSPQGAGSGPLVDYDQSDLGLGTSPPHRPPPELSSFPPGEYAPVPPTRPGGRVPLPRPPMPSEPTELVRVVRRPSSARNTVLGTLLGALIGFGAGYLLWGVDHAALGVGALADEVLPADEPPTQAKPVRRSARDAVPAPRATRPPADDEAAQPPSPATAADADAGPAQPTPD
jgi:uncharacterized membrane protein